MLRRSRVSCVLALACAAWPAGAHAAGAPPTITSLPAVDAATVVADNATQYTVTMTVSDPNGYGDVRCLRVLFNYTEAGGDTSLGRGLLAWGKTDGDIMQYGGTWVCADASGGGRWGYRTDAWGGTTYLTPINATLTNSGKASGGSGSRTVAWTFTAKPAWGSRPVMNDADGWAADALYTTGWRDGEASFDVVDAPCNTLTPTPYPPVVSDATATTVRIAIDPRDTATDLFCIRVSPGVGGRSYLQTDGTLGAAPVWNVRTAWGTKTVKGLTWNTTYRFSARAYRYALRNCPSSWSADAVITTAAHVPEIDFHGGTPFSPQVRGQCPYRSIPASGYGAVWADAIRAGARGLAGGLDADTYDWRDIDSGSNWGLVGGHFTTLEFLQYARDHEAVPVITANAFGGGAQDPNNGGVFVCQTVDPDKLAADWVRYTNTIVQQYREGDEGALTGEDRRVYDSIVNWGGRPKLPSATEAPPPKVRYWEIGNEPELGGIDTFLTNHYLGPADYCARYKQISEAMLAVDPSLKFGCSLMDPSPQSGSGQWLSALAADPNVRLDFVGYHPYYSAIKSNWGYPADGTTGALRAYKAFLESGVAGIHAIMTQYGRAGYDLMATEWNPLNWDATGQQQSSMAMALSVAEGCFTFAESGVLAAHFWEQPQNKLGAHGMFGGLRDHMGDTLIDSSTRMGLAPADIDWRLYVTRDSRDPFTIMIWGLNFHDTQPVEVSLSLQPCRVVSATLKRYGVPGDDANGGDTSLLHYAGMAWTSQDVTSGFNPAGFTLALEDAEAAVLVVSLRPLPDFDRDADVDLADFAGFQYCFNGPNRAPVSAACYVGDLDIDGDVDLADFAVFQRCFNGPNRPVACTD